MKVTADTITDAHRAVVEIRGDLMRYACSCGVAGHWGRSLWTHVNYASCEAAASRHVATARAAAEAKP